MTTSETCSLKFKETGIINQSSNSMIMHADTIKTIVRFEINPDVSPSKIADNRIEMNKKPSRL